MPRREVAPPDLPDVPFAALSAGEQARCVGWNLRLARKRAGYTLPALIAHMQRSAPEEAVSVSYLGDIERGDRMPSLATVLALARALGIDPRVLFGRTVQCAAKTPGTPAAPGAGAAGLRGVDADAA